MEELNINSNIKEVIKFLEENPVQYLATVGRDGKGKVRPFMFCIEHNKKLWFCTNNKKDVFKDMQNNPYIEISTSSASYSWIRLSGKGVFEDNKEVKEKCISTNPIVKEQYKIPDNPLFEVFYIDEACAIIEDINGNPPKIYNL